MYKGTKAELIPGFKIVHLQFPPNSSRPNICAAITGFQPAPRSHRGSHRKLGMSLIRHFPFQRIDTGTVNIGFGYIDFILSIRYFGCFQ